jgi:prepilin-type processing-associated H-X9-DG protein
VLVRDDYLHAVTFCCPHSLDDIAPGATRAQQADNLLKGGHCSYIYLGKGLNNKSDGNLLLVYEPVTNHLEGINALYADGHTEWITRRVNLDPQIRATRQTAATQSSTRPTTTPAKQSLPN